MYPTSPVAGKQRISHASSFNHYSGPSRKTVRFAATDEIIEPEEFIELPPEESPTLIGTPLPACPSSPIKGALTPLCASMLSKIGWSPFAPPDFTNLDEPACLPGSDIVLTLTSPTYPWSIVLHLTEKSAIRDVFVGIITGLTQLVNSNEFAAQPDDQKRLIEQACAARLKYVRPTWQEGLKTPRLLRIDFLKTLHFVKKITPINMGAGQWCIEFATHS